jgi:predicted porin
MKKKIFTGLVCGMLATSVGLAAPQVDVPKGELHIEYTYTPDTSNDLTLHPSGSSLDRDGKASQYGLTYGLGKGYALYLSSGEYKLDRLNFSPITATPKLDIKDIQIQKRLDKHTDAFIGVKQLTTKVDLGTPIGTFGLHTDKENLWEVGVIGKTQLAKKTNGYAKVGFGKDLQEYKVGLTYDLSKQAQFDLGYGYLKIDDLDLVDSNRYDATSKGWYYGLNFKF